MVECHGGAGAACAEISQWPARERSGARRLILLMPLPRRSGRERQVQHAAWRVQHAAWRASLEVLACVRVAVPGYRQCRTSDNIRFVEQCCMLPACRLLTGSPAKTRRLLLLAFEGLNLPTGKIRAQSTNQFCARHIASKVELFRVHKWLRKQIYCYRQHCKS